MLSDLNTFIHCLFWVFQETYPYPKPEQNNILQVFLKQGANLYQSSISQVSNLLWVLKWKSTAHSPCNWSNSSVDMLGEHVNINIKSHRVHHQLVVWLFRSGEWVLPVHLLLNASVSLTPLIQLQLAPLWERFEPVSNNMGGGPLIMTTKSVASSISY